MALVNLGEIIKEQLFVPTKFPLLKFGYEIR